MKKGRRGERVKKSYLPDKLIANYMHEKLRFERKKEELKLRGEELSENKAYSNLKKRKTDVLNRVFISMANLTFFFECIAEHPEFEELFEDDVKDLLGVRYNSSKFPDSERIYGFMLFNLLDSILGLKRADSKQDFRLRLNYLLQQIVWNKSAQYLDEVFKTEGVKGAVSNDFDRVKAWTGMLAHGIDEEVKEPSRTFDFHTDELLK